MDALHGALTSAIGGLVTAIGVLWRQNTNLRKQLDDQYHSQLADVKQLTREAIELARAATYAPPLKRSVLPPNDSRD